MKKLSNKRKLKYRLAEDYCCLHQKAWSSANCIEDAYLAGFEDAKQLITQDITQWLLITGAIPIGTSYYYELIGGCTEAGEEDVHMEEQ